MAQQEAAVQVDGGDEAFVVPHLDGNIMSMILSKLPSELAHCFAVISKPSRELLLLRYFLEHHHSPRPLAEDELPSMVVIQPKDHQRPGGYVHLTIVNTADPANPVLLHLPVHHAYQHLIAEHASAASLAEGELATFLVRTIPKLDASFVASDGPMLLARNPTRTYFVCYPAANRWIALPPPPAGDTVAAGFRCDVVDAASGTTSFMVVLVARDQVTTFSSKTSQWETKVHDNDMGLFSASGPGMRAGNSIYWLSAAGDGRARVLCFDVARGRASAFSMPPLADGATKRVGRSLGSTGGRLRLCTFDVRANQPGNDGQPHAVEGVHGVFFLDDDDAGTWRRVHEVVVPVRDDISLSFFGVPHGAEVPVDFAGASGSSIIVNKNQVLFCRHLESGNKVRLFDLNKRYGRMARLYNSLDVFPLFQ